jgi:hypothetical protein
MIDREGDARDGVPGSQTAVSRGGFSASAPQTPNGLGPQQRTPVQSTRTPDGSYNDNGQVASPNDGRTLSNSPMEQESYSQGSNGKEAKIHSRKRGSVDAIDYPRRRAVIAVRYTIYTYDSALLIVISV